MSHLLSLIHTPSFTEYIEHFSYVGVFIWFMTFDFIAPFPDEISLLTIGYMASRAIFSPIIVGFVALASFLLTDTLSFFIVRRGQSFLTKKLKKPERHSIRAYVSKHLEKNLPGTLIAICFIPRMRLWGPIVAGTSKISFRRFITFDAVGVALFTALYEALGYFFGVSLSALFHRLQSLQTTIFVGLLLVLGVALIFISNKVAEREYHE